MLPDLIHVRNSAHPVIRLIKETRPCRKSLTHFASRNLEQVQQQPDDTDLPFRAFPLPCDEVVLLRLAEVHASQAPQGQNLAAQVVAAAAEVAGLCVLHYDADYDRIAVVTDQPTEWVAPAGTLD